MLIVISAVASAVALLGALLVGYSTQTTIKQMVATRDPNSVLVAFPADVEEQIKQQSMVSTGVATMQPPAQLTIEQEHEITALTLRGALGRAANGDLHSVAENGKPDLAQLTATLQSLLLEPADESPEIGALRDYALRELTTPEGVIALPAYELDNQDLDQAGLAGELASQLTLLQDDLNQQIASLPELQDRQITEQAITLSGDQFQLAGAIEALELQVKMLGADFTSDSRYAGLQALSEQLLRNGDGSQVSLDGLDLSELESVSRDLLAQLNDIDGTSNGAAPDTEADLD